jgi:hypothetical protein
MKKPLLIVIIILAVILALPVISFFSWAFQTKKPMGIIIHDKTVPNFDRVKHKSFTWILTNNRFVKKEKKTSYSVSKDYLGFSPLRPSRDKKFERRIIHLTTDLMPLAENNDAVYYTDTYGVYFNDWYQGINKSRRSRKLFGGSDNNDNLLIAELKKKNKLIVLEYNTFDYPTDELTASNLENKLGIEFPGKWSGKYFSSLDTNSTDFPVWMTAIYRKQYKKPWTFTKPGIVILRDRAIVVLEEGTNLKDPVLHIISDSAYCAKWNLPKSVAFDQWFDIIDPLRNNVISKFRIETTSFGDSLLANYGLDNEFPAVVQDSTQRTYYFSGDFCYFDIPSWTSRFKGIDKLHCLLYSKKPDDTRRFFWLYYKPLIEGIFTDYYNSLSAK